MKGQILFAIVAVAIVGFGVSRSPISSSLSIRFAGSSREITNVAGQGREVSRKRLRMARLESGMVGRSAVLHGQYRVLIAHLPTRFQSRDEMEQVLEGDPDTLDDDLQLFREPRESPWYVPADRLSDLTTFNCATYALGKSAGLNQKDWLEPMATCWTNREAPAEVILKHEYRLVSSTPWTAFGELAVADLGGSQDGDVVAFVDSRQRSGYLHFAVVRMIDGTLQLVSKLGTGPIAYGTLKQTGLRWKDSADQLLVFRRRLI